MHTPSSPARQVPNRTQVPPSDRPGPVTQTAAAPAPRRHPLLQLGFVALFWLAGEGIGRATGLPLPGGVIGLGLLLVLLASGRLALANVKRGAEWLLADMLLFFVPAVLAVLDHRDFFGLLGLKILFVILASTTAVMLVTAWVVERCHRWRLQRVPASGVR
ncbi:CidA/LrgA family protein [Verticiella sediminum]|uniref:CidA/LrgA family protein n=1 Tax=Verticiella sediminum TaxID=1247510 RepID=A0A556AIK1_9BURK|nr:CidA/LrgA family protein [Verticiella sediminum]TSH92732.1 CidA/LrgA family protein [Verticiella sediminum]